MPLLYGIIIICLIIWFVGNVIGETIENQKEAATGGKRFACIEGKLLAGFHCELTGEEFQRAKKVIEDNINEYDAELFKLLEKYGREPLSTMTIGLNCWRGNNGCSSSKKDKPKRDLYTKCEKEYDALMDKFNSKPFPVLRKYDSQETFGEVGWNGRHPWIKMIHDKYSLGSDPYEWAPYVIC